MRQILGARWIGDGNLYSLLIDSHGRLQAVDPLGRTWPEATTTVELGGGWVSPGVVDLQLNGALGAEFSELAGDEGLAMLERISRYLYTIGVSAWLPTLISVPVEKLVRSMALIARFKAPADGARILGVHLEGPFLNPEYEGAHMRQHLLPFTLDNVRRVLGDYTSLVRLVTVAPELDREGVIPWLVERSIEVSLGHTSATFEEASRAFDSGARLVTHIFNAQRPFHHREPGVVGAALLDERVRCLCIPDGIHLHPATTRLLLKIKGASGLLPVSDAVAPLGLADGEYDWHGAAIRVAAGRVSLKDGRLAGSALSLIDVIERLVSDGVTRGEALQMTTINPRLLLGEALEWPIGGDLLLWPATHSRPMRLEELRKRPRAQGHVAFRSSPDRSP